MSKSLLDRVQIATPCETNWEAMQGDDRVRHCSHCDKHVYNLSQMTRQQAEALLSKTNGKLCARFERGADGGILTTDQTLSLPRFNFRFLRIASATISAALSLSPTVAAKTSKNLPVLQQQDKKEKSAEQAQEKENVARIYGRVIDASEAVIPNTVITAINELTKQSWKTISSANGEYEFLLPVAENYSLTFEAAGFKKFTRSGLNLKSSASLNIVATMEVGAVTMGVIVIADAPVKPSVPDENLKLDLKESPKQTEEIPSLQNKKSKRNLLDVLLAPIKKINDGKKED